MHEKKPCPFQAAKASWLAPLIAIGLGILTSVFFTNDPNTDPGVVRFIKGIVALVALLIVLLGLVFGVLALFGIKKYGAKGILIPSIIGIILSGGYLLLAIYSIIAVLRLIQERAIPPA